MPKALSQFSVEKGFSFGGLSGLGVGALQSENSAAILVPNVLFVSVLTP